MINWQITVNAELKAEIAGGVANQRAYIYQDNSLFHAVIEEITDYGWCLMADKEDASIIELMHWVEEELKFRFSAPKADFF